MSCTCRPQIPPSLRTPPLDPGSPTLTWHDHSSHMLHPPWMPHPASHQPRKDQSQPPPARNRHTTPSLTHHPSTDVPPLTDMPLPPIPWDPPPLFPLTWHDHTSHVAPYKMLFAEVTPVFALERTSRTLLVHLARRYGCWITSDGKAIVLFLAACVKILDKCSYVWFNLWLEKHSLASHRAKRDQAIN